jgi:uncharacterized UBP type Zn finger protein
MSPGFRERSEHASAATTTSGDSSMGDTDTFCAHIASIKQHVRPHTRGCEECLSTGDSWVHLRLCMQCGHVGCCNDSKNRHATKHFKATQHPIIRSLEPGETWGWCFVDEMGFDPLSG